jgi:hypothetical protein
VTYSFDGMPCGISRGSVHASLLFTYILKKLKVLCEWYTSLSILLWTSCNVIVPCDTTFFYKI